MRVKLLFILALLGIVVGIMSVVLYNEKVNSEPPIAVSYNPYVAGIYATGIVESSQPNGSNVNIFPEVSGRVTNILLRDRQIVKKGTPILTIDDSVQREIVAKDIAQIRFAIANYDNVGQQLEKIQKSYELNCKSVSQNVLDNAINAVKIAKENISVAQKQYQSDKALWEKYVLRAPIDGMILRIVSATGDYVSPLGSYDTYTQGMLPTIQMGVITPDMHVRAYVDELLVPNLPPSSNLEATMFIRGLNNKKIPLTFVSLQPFTIPNIELSDQRNERVDVRVLPIIFKFKKPTDINVFPGQLVDIFIKGKK